MTGSIWIERKLPSLHPNWCARRLVTFTNNDPQFILGVTVLYHSLCKKYIFPARLNLKTPLRQVEEKLAERLGLEDPTKLRMTVHNVYTHQPQKNALRWRGPHSLERMLHHGHANTDILYYEVLDIPLQQFEQLKTLKVRHLCI